MPEDMFQEGVYIFEDGQLDQVGLAAADGSPLVMLSCKGFPYVGVWSKPGRPFVCLEPWYGRSDNKDFAGDLSQKTGVQKLERDGVFHVCYSITVDEGRGCEKMKTQWFSPVEFYSCGFARLNRNMRMVYERDL